MYRKSGVYKHSSKFIADGVKKLYPQAADKLNVVYSGVNVEKYSPNWSSTGMANKLILKTIQFVR